ncbi:hypothetical protein M407DRAFT_22579 [Tulasnella calospora MUT 4182]|uniref:Peptide hydrolase n=1 Tax=Tulasnella calospora MUT 4182 TaxID=1051891 RepID=A0A0C3L3E0_9AGAM|nr:hypothetical protein M407DRAFT_22579 [Tulasnella calospora MUT 4182]
MAYLEDEEAELVGEERHLVWLQDAGVDDSLRVDEDLVLSDMSIVPKLLDLAEMKSRSENPICTTSTRTPLSSPFFPPRDARHLPPSLRRPHRPTRNPSPLLRRRFAKIHRPTRVARIQDIIANLKFNPSIAAILSSLSTERMAKDAFTDGAKAAAELIQGEIEKSGAVCELRPFRLGFAPNVICRYPSTVNTTGTTIISARYDSRGSFGSLRAPGGDDDGSGTTDALAIARLIKEKKITFKSRVELVLFAGEEQGLVGSRAYSAQLRQANPNITLHMQADMLAFRSPKEPLQLGPPDLIGLPEAAYLVANISKLYAPELTVVYTSACCIFLEGSRDSLLLKSLNVQGRSSTPCNNNGDLTNRTGCDFNQLLSITKVTFATVLETAGFDIVPVEDE